MNIIKCAPIVLVLAAIFAGCSGASSPVEEVCAKEASCGFAGGAEAEDQCTSVGEDLFASLRKDAACAALADLLESELACAADLPCDDVQKLFSIPVSIESPERLPQEFPCRAELIAVAAEINGGTCALSGGLNPGG